MGGMADDRRNLQAGALLAAVGAVLLLVSLFMHWYQPDFTAWRVLEALDLVLAATAITALLAAAEGMGWRGPVEARGLPALGVLATIIVVGALINHPPAVDGLPKDTGIWLALAGALTLLVGGALTVARVSIAVSWQRVQRGPGAPAASEPVGEGPPTQPLP
jgi:peptidoglycan/LPS O-acetylase OafA/YrhL